MDGNIKINFSHKNNANRQNAHAHKVQCYPDMQCDILRHLSAQQICNVYSVTGDLYLVFKMFFFFVCSFFLVLFSAQPFLSAFFCLNMAYIIYIAFRFNVRRTHTFPTRFHVG